VSRYCLDTSAYSHFQRGDADVVALLDGAQWVGVPAVVLGELRTGFILGGRRERHEAQLRDFLAHPAVDVVAVDDEVSRHYAEIVCDLRAAGSPLPTNDVWIAATASRAGALLLTYDAHFAGVARVGSLVLRR
jgi:predicted nucleic acid-binding protein